MPDWNEIDDFPNGPTTAQLDFIDALQEQLDLELGDILEMAEKIAGCSVNALRELSMEDASELIDELKERRHDGRR